MRAFTSILTIAALAASVVAVPFKFELGARNETESLEKRDFSGQFTWYDISVGETACGGFNQPYEYVVALNGAQWSGGSNCYKLININAWGKSTQAAIVDLCPGCPYGGLDLTTGLFDYFTWAGAAGSSTDPGVIYGDWSFA